MRHVIIFVSALSLACATGVAQTPGTLRLSAAGALATLQAGNARYVAGTSQPRPLGEGTRRTLKNARNPVAIVVTCADSRVPPEHVFNAGLGELFVIRTAGNVCDPETLASIEYAAVHLGTRLCVVMAHTHCGAVQTTASGVRETPALGMLMERIHPAVELARGEGLTGREMLHRAETENAYHTIAEALRRSKDLVRLAKSGKFVMRAAHYQLATGKVDWLPERRDDHVHGAAHLKYKPHARGLPPHVALTMLQAGHRRFLSNARSSGNITKERRQSLVKGQRPIAVVVTCADSRVPPEHIFDAGLGELFVIRVAGNVASNEVVASIEYAVAHTGAGLCLVLGHEGCGAVAAAIHHSRDADLSPSMRQLLAKIEPSVERARRKHDDDGHQGEFESTDPGLLARAIEENTLRFMTDLRQRSDLLTHLEAQGTFEMVPAVYMLGTGDLVWLQKPERVHAVIPGAATAEHRDGHNDDWHAAGHGPAGHGDPHAEGPAHDHTHAHTHTGASAVAHGEAHVGFRRDPTLPPAAPRDRPPPDGLIMTLAVAAMMSIAGMLGLLFWQRRG